MCPATVLHVAANNGTGFTASGPLEFLNTWTYKLGSEILTPFGRSQLFNLGVGFRVKYGELLKGFTDHIPDNVSSYGSLSLCTSAFSEFTFYAASTSLLVSSASSPTNHPTTNFLRLKNKDLTVLSLLREPVQTPTANNAIGIAGFTFKWVPKYLIQAQARFAPFIRGFELGPQELVGMQQMCALETVALGYSAFF
ncbi:hypothetical protein D9758_010177 [Tetrapyrgos nigripes]|uniref:Uncharacterized protein n=1 Tax=Tetrapyrgos nigripes TaxID=182062 RepID=A0A8H5CXH3_9AGAR|nr:hypothetical protein D9758_010177 [Tetrapyrgos nigripes]